MAGIVREIEIAGNAAEARIESIIGLGIIGIIVGRVDPSVEIRPGISDVESADPALDGERGLGEAVMVALGAEEMLDLEGAEARIVAERAVGMLVLAEQRGGHRPMLG